MIDDYAEGKDSGIIDLVLIGDIDRGNLLDLTGKTEKYIGRKIRTLVLNRADYYKMQDQLQKRPLFLLWELEKVG